MIFEQVKSTVDALLRDHASLAELVEATQRDRRRERDEILREVLEIADGIERLQFSANPEVGSALATVLVQVNELLLGHDLVSFRPKLGDVVDGRTCEVMASVSIPGLRPGAVTRVLRAGYKLGDRTIRRAGVEVVKE